jgi:Protein of unknown function DUF262/Protein of unknown function (DUF1524)
MEEMTLGEPMFRPEPHPVERFFRLKWPLFVDPYQRDYAWDANDEIADFIADLGRVIERGDTPDATPHFFGLIVAARHPNDGWERSEKLEVIDGQQRLATFVLFAAALRQTATEIAGEAGADDSQTASKAKGFAASLEEAFIEANDRSTQTWEEKPFSPLTLTTPDDRFFRRLLKGQPDPPTRHSHELLSAAYASLRDAIDEWLSDREGPAARQDRLTEIRGSVLTRSELILIRSDQRVDAYRVFSILNDRGKQLEQADLLRSYILSLVRGRDDDTRREVAADWNNLDKEAPRHVDAALRQYYASKVGRRAPKVNVFDGYCADILGTPGDDPTDEQVSNVIAAVKEIRKAAHLYKEFTDGAWPTFVSSDGRKGVTTEWERKLLPRLTLNLKSQRVIPYLMSGAMRWVQDETMFVRLVRFIEKAELRLMVSRAHPSTVADRFFEAAKRVREDSVDDVIKYVEPYVYQLADDDTFETRLGSLRYSRNRALITHLLAMVEDHLPWYRRGAGGAPATNELKTFDMGKVTLDHIYPQSPKEGEVDEKLEPLRHRLGNLTILVDQDNSAIQNVLPSAPEKLAVYNDAVQMTREVAATIRKEGWTEQTIQDREKELISVLMLIYAVSDEAKDAASKLTTKRGRRAAEAAEKRKEPLLWSVAEDGKTGGASEPGKAFRFGTGLRAGASVLANDYLFVFRRVRKGGKRDWPNDEIIGIARIGDIKQHTDSPARENRTAVFSNYLELETPITFSELEADDPRDASHSSIHDGSLEQLEKAVKLAGLDDPEDLPAVKPSGAESVPPSGDEGPAGNVPSDSSPVAG